MKCNFNIEINGITEIIICGTLFKRMDNRDWYNTKTSKIVRDPHMWARVKRMMYMKKYVSFPIKKNPAKVENVGDWFFNYRAWMHTNTLNIEKVHYD